MRHIRDSSAIKFYIINSWETDGHIPQPKNLSRYLDAQNSCISTSSFYPAGSDHYPAYPPISKHMLPALIRSGTADEPPTYIPPPGALGPVLHVGPAPEVWAPDWEDTPPPRDNRARMAPPRITQLGSYTYLPERSQEDEDADLAEAMQESWNMSSPAAPPTNSGNNQEQQPANPIGLCSDQHCQSASNLTGSGTNTGEQQTARPAGQHPISVAVTPEQADQAPQTPRQSSHRSGSIVQTTGTSSSPPLPADDSLAGTEVVPANTIAAEPTCFHCQGHNRVRDIIPARLCRSCAHQCLAGWYDEFLDWSEGQVDRSDRLGWLRAGRRHLAE